MRYFFISDVHGEYDKMIKALKKAHFRASKDTLVSVGDAFDRGSKSLEVLKFIMSCPHRIIILGNHDVRLRDLLLGKDFLRHADFHNGVPATLESFCGETLAPEVLLYNLRKSDAHAEVRKLLWQYLDEGCYALEWKDLIVTHAWIPTVDKVVSKLPYRAIPEFDDRWREVPADYWEIATWTNSLEAWGYAVFPDKTLMIGHFCTALFRDQSSDNYIRENADLSIFKDKHIIALDGWSNISFGRVNVFKYKSNAEPIYYTGH